MVAADIIALVAILLGGGVGLRALVGWFKRREELDVVDEKHRQQRMTDLREALRSHDHRRIDDFIAMWGNETPPDMLQYVKERRDELYIEDNTRDTPT